MSSDATVPHPENDTELLEQTIKDPALASAVLEIESHVAQEGWEQPARLYALVDTLRFIEAEPRMAAAMGLDTNAVPGSLTAVEQEQYGPERQIEEVLAGIVWPETVDGCAVVLERLALPPEADAEMPEDPEERAAYARNHPQAQIVRMAAGATRAGNTYCALRLKAHDDDFAVVDGTEMVPELVELVLSTLHEGAPDGAGDQP
ncbi:PPA1309 family protein [Nocardioides yefusunii]|uniref:PPA1309 family protein n=1 Tax=Nocardioides yefusunii TaxID=2500546 RepID=A0ABW1R1P7_9ACTN|nr:PPA1309 family protein [Nocardioides yefusunii]